MRKMTPINPFTQAIRPGETFQVCTVGGGIVKATAIKDSPVTPIMFIGEDGKRIFKDRIVNLQRFDQKF